MSPAADKRSEPQPSISGALLALVLLLALGVPPFLHLPLTNDAALYDVQAEQLLSGGVLYRDYLEPNLPGIVWLHAAIRSTFGWSTLAIRAVDLSIYAAAVWLLARCIVVDHGSTRARLWTSAALCGFYLSLSEWCHCQRDMWMLLPAVAAMTLRRRQLARLAAGEKWPAVVTQGVLEGAVWGAAVWIKPHVMLPALACWLVGAVCVRRGRPLAIDALAVLAGGVAAGAAGIVWLQATGAWPSLLETMRAWNPHYFAAGREHWTLARFLGMTLRLSPWLLLHVAAVPLALGAIAAVVRVQSSSHDESREAQRQRISFPLLAALYLGWTVQSFALQHLFDYVHAPAVALAIAVLASAVVKPNAAVGWKPAVIGFLALALWVGPLVDRKTLHHWTACLRLEDSRDLRRELARLQHPYWEHLDRVVDYLRSQGVRDGGLHCFNSDLVTVYRELDVQPPTRFIYLRELVAYFPDRLDVFEQSLEAHPHEYVVSDLVGSFVMSLPDTLAVGPEGAAAPPPKYPRRIKGLYPWSHPVVFRSGPYLVHRVEGPPGRLNGR